MVEIAQDEAATTGESPLWDDVRGVLWWIDIQGKRLLGLHSERGPLPPVFMPAEIGLVALAEDGTLVLGLEDGLYRFVPETGGLSRLSKIPAPHPNLRLNDGKPDRQGRLWFGTMDKSGSGIPVGALYCRHPGGRIDMVRTEVRIPNAIATSLDGGTLFFSDSPSQQILAFDLDVESGSLANKRVFHALHGDEKPDGAIIDARGDMWLAVVHASRIDHIDRSGRRINSITVPVTKPTMAAFGGPDLRDLYVTSQRRFLGEAHLAEQPNAGRLLRISGIGQGCPANRVRL